MTGDEKRVYYENPKRQRTWVLPDEPDLSTPKRNIHAEKVMLCRGETLPWAICLFRLFLIYLWDKFEKIKITV